MPTTNNSSMAGQFDLVTHPEFDVAIVLAIRKGSELPVEVRRYIEHWRPSSQNGYFRFYNEERPHPAAEDRLPAEVYLG